jgi:hypothetical protein
MIKGGPKIIDDNLVVCLDAHDAKSYAGEPTQNYVINTLSTGGWWGDGSSQTGLGSKGAVAITDENLKYNGYDTVLWTPGTSRNCYLNSTEDFNYSETSTEWTFSAYLKYEDGSTISSMSVYMYYPSSDGSGTGTVTDVGGGWYRVRRTRTGSSNYIALAGFTGIAAMKKIYISGWQLEKKQYTTPVTSPATSRSATNGWVDRSGNSSSGTLTNMIGTGVTHYRDGQVIMPVANSYLEFDGTNDSIVIDDVSNISLTTGSVEAWVKMDSISGNRVIVAYGGNGTNTGWLLQNENSTSNKIGFAVFGAASAYSGNTLSTGYLNNWTHFVGTYGGGAVKFYANGALVTSTTTGTNVSSSSTLRIGNEYNRSYFLDGQLGLVRIYNKTLSAAEVLSNYNATKNRFT